MKFQTNSKLLLHKEVELNKLDTLAKEIVSNLPNSAIILLNGNLAAGKTTLVNQIVKAIDINSSLATSPTFSLQQCYGENIFHYDFYRVEFNDIIELGLLEEFEKKGFHFIEWADDKLIELLKEAGFSLYSITITSTKEDLRDYKLEVINA